MNTTNAFPKTIYAIQHLAFEDLGSLEDVFYQLGFRVRYFEAGVDDLTAAFAKNAPIKVLVIACLLDFADLDKVVNPALRSPAIKDFIA